MAAPVFPSHDINPKDKLKDSKWILGFIKGMWDEFQSQSIKSFHKGVERYNLNALYSIGKQPNDIYKPMFEISDDSDYTFMNLDFSPPPIIPKFKRITLNKFSKSMEDFRVAVEAIDPRALEDKTDYEAEERANIKMREILSQMGLPANQFNTGEMDQPMDEEELAIKMEFGWKHDDAIQIEKSIDTVFNHERLKDKMSEVRDHGFDRGLLAVKPFTDESSGRVGFRTVDPANVVVSPTKDRKFGDIWYCGEHILMTIDEIRKNANGEISEEDLMDLATKNCGKYGNPNSFNHAATGNAAYDSFKVPVLDMEFLSKDTKVREERVGKYGNNVSSYVDNDSPRKEGREYHEECKIVVYRGKWIVNTDLIFDWGLKSDMPRKEDSLWDTRLSYILCAPEMNMFETVPIVENLIAITDQITIAWYKLQNVMARARPKGIAIEIGALEDISLGDGGDGMRPIDILDMFTKTGNLVYRRINLEGAPANYKPIEELQNGLGTEAAEHFAVIEKYMAMIREMIGFNDFTDGSTPDPKALNGVGQMAIEGTNNALYHLLEAERYVVERLAEDIAVRVHDSILYKKNSPYRSIVVPDGQRSLNSYDGTMERVYNIVLDYGSEKKDENKLERRIEISLANKEITLADVVAIERVRNIKQAETLLAYRIKKNQMIARQMADADKASNAEASIAAARAAEEEKRKTIEMETRSEIAKIKAEQEKEASLLILEYALKGQNEMPKLASKEKIAELANQHKENMEAFKSQSAS